MRGAALYFCRKIPSPAGYDGLIASDLLALADLKALWGPACPPCLAYFHENQLTYPLAPGESLDVQFGFTNITTALAADRVQFNSRYHHDAFFARLPGFLRLMPEYRPLWVMERIRRKSAVLYPGCRFPAAGPPPIPPAPPDGAPARPPLIIWNHRWEFDKNPAEFFAALDAVRRRGREFRLALLGESFQKKPQDFLAARERYGSRIERYGYVPDREEYYGWLRRGGIVVSTALQENFGIAVIEAVRHGCLPLLPRRLSYPEILPPACHDEFLYRDPPDLVEKLDLLLRSPGRFQRRRAALAAAMGAYAWETLAGRYDAELETLARDPQSFTRGLRGSGAR